MHHSREEALLKKLSEFKRKAWTPVTSEGDGSITSCKFSGMPWLSAEESWPTCRHCRRPMPLLLQLNLAELPNEVGMKFGQGLLQLFYCTNEYPRCEAECNGWEPFSASQLVRLVQPSARMQVIRMPEFERDLAAGCITGWEETDDYPDHFECEENGISLDDGEIHMLADSYYPRPSHKLAGWPFWVQYIDYPQCRRCGRRMELVFQLDSDCRRYTFGDAGIGHITKCREHKDEVAFGWACS